MFIIFFNTLVEESLMTFRKINIEKYLKRERSVFPQRQETQKDVEI